MTKLFQELQVSDYFRIPGISAETVYRKASNSHCSLNIGLQPIQPETLVIPLSATEIADYFAAKQALLNDLRM